MSGEIVEEPVTIPVGEIELEGLLSLPSQASNVGVVVCHPHPLYGGDMYNNVVSALVEAFQAQGVATLRFNFRGVGNSTGSHAGGIGETNDVKAAVSYLLSRHALSTVAVAGYSFGSFVGLASGANDPRVHKLIAVALPIATRDPSFLNSVAKPILLISGDRDDYSPIPELSRLVSKLPDPKTLVVVEGADHFWRGMEGRVAEAAVAFLAD
jgi:uncharacterized protein